MAEEKQKYNFKKINYWNGGVEIRGRFGSPRDDWFKYSIIAFGQQGDYSGTMYEIDTKVDKQHDNFKLFRLFINDKIKRLEGDFEGGIVLRVITHKGKKIILHPTFRPQYSEREWPRPETDSDSD